MVSKAPVSPAHTQSGRPAGPPDGRPPLDRETREHAATHELAAGAAKACGAGNRLRSEPPDPLRTAFERDRDRILHSTAFRRLGGKTQVFIFPGDHQRTRLTHALEVAQVATAIARACQLNVALAEAIALGHDCGHGPFGHASEGALSPYLSGGFDHAVWGADVVGAELNLCVETLDGIRNHSWRRPRPFTLEGEVVAWADRIAYVCHDFEDAVSAGILERSDLPTSVVAACGLTRSSQLHSFITAVIDNITSLGSVGMDVGMASALDTYRTHNFERIYLRPASVAQAAVVTSMLRALVEHLAGDPALLPHGNTADNDPIEAAVAYVAGMTDRFACRLAVRELDWPLDELPRGFDLFG